jgi:hypothetical protein
MFLGLPKLSFNPFFPPRRTFRVRAHFPTNGSPPQHYRMTCWFQSLLRQGSLSNAMMLATQLIQCLWFQSLLRQGSLSNYTGYAVDLTFGLWLFQSLLRQGSHSNKRMSEKMNFMSRKGFNPFFPPRRTFRVRAQFA